MLIRLIWLGKKSFKGIRKTQTFVEIRHVNGIPSLVLLIWSFLTTNDESYRMGDTE